jgi:hypothetical protein
VANKVLIGREYYRQLLEERSRGIVAGGRSLFGINSGELVGCAAWLEGRILWIQPLGESDKADLRLKSPPIVFIDELYALSARDTLYNCISSSSYKNFNRRELLV